jgi:hypothetical protein
LVSAFDGLKRLKSAPLPGQDYVRAFCPYEWFGVGIVLVEKVADGALELGDGRESAAPNALGHNLGEEALDEVEPGGTGWREVHFETEMLESQVQWRAMTHHGANKHNDSYLSASEIAASSSMLTGWILSASDTAADEAKALASLPICGGVSSSRGSADA